MSSSFFTNDKEQEEEEPLAHVQRRLKKQKWQRDYASSSPFSVSKKAMSKHLTIIAKHLDTLQRRKTVLRSASHVQRRVAKHLVVVEETLTMVKCLRSSWRKLFALRILFAILINCRRVTSRREKSYSTFSD